MSTKIYDAYIFNKNYNLLELNQIGLELREKIKNKAIKDKATLILKEFFYFYDYYKTHTKEEIQEKVDDMQKQYDAIDNVFVDNVLKYRARSLLDVWKTLYKDELHRLLYKVESYIDSQIEAVSKNPTIMNSDYDFRCHLQVIPLEDKILAMYFGRYEFQKVLEDTPYLSDYHYQNQCDKPENISDKDWDKRKNDWDKALDPDYIPMNHGFQLDMFDYVYGFGFMNLKAIIQGKMPTLEQRVNRIVETMKDYPNPPSKEDGYRIWMDYYRSDAYKEWEETKKVELREKLEKVEEEELLLLK